MTQLLDLTTYFGNIFQPWHIIILLVVIVLFFGGAKIPELMKGVGQGMGEFKKGMEESKTAPKDEEDDSKPKSA
jgi:sec-independent protein translocase protein TatA